MEREARSLRELPAQQAKQEQREQQEQQEQERQHQEEQQRKSGKSSTRIQTANLYYRFGASLARCARSPAVQRVGAMSFTFFRFLSGRFFQNPNGIAPTTAPK